MHFSRMGVESHLLTAKQETQVALTARVAAISIYRVEVSGWDAEENFFVEKAELEWDESDGKIVRLSRALRKGSIVFVRLLQTTSDAQSYPIAYAVEPFEELGEGPREFRLKQIHPRMQEGHLPA